MRSLTIGSLFSGIGGLELGLERAGLGPTLWQVEQDPYACAVLAKHWPDATRYEDVRHVGANNLRSVDVICGGFPCQDISTAGRGAGLAGARSGLWWEFARIIREMGPRYVVVENVAALLRRGFDDVLGFLADSGYDAEWSCVQAADVGAPHYRDRVFLVAYLADTGRGRVQHQRDAGALAGARREVEGEAPQRERSGHATGDCGANLADADCWGREECRLTEPTRLEGTRGNEPIGCSAIREFDDAETWGEAWRVEPDVDRVVDGLPARVHRLRALGNAVVPQVAEVVGRVVMDLEHERLMESVHV